MAFLIINQALCEMWETEGLPRTVGNRRFSMVRHFHQGKKACGIGGDVYSHFHGFHTYMIKSNIRFLPYKIRVTKYPQKWGG